MFGSKAQGIIFLDCFHLITRYRTLSSFQLKSKCSPARCRHQTTQSGIDEAGEGGFVYPPLSLGLPPPQDCWAQTLFVHCSSRIDNALKIGINVNNILQV